MPNTRSAKKRLRQNVARRAANRNVKRTVRTQCRKVREAILAGDVELAETEFRAAMLTGRKGVNRMRNANA